MEIMTAQLILRIAREELSDIQLRRFLSHYIANRKCLLNGNSFILGVSGSGKSFTGKCEIANLMLAGDPDIIIIDPEREYAPLVKAMGGAIIDISATSKNHINAMDAASYVRGGSGTSSYM